MSFSWFVARRYLTARRRQAFISLISAVSILGVGVGVMALIIALALMTGVQTELQDRLVGSTAHIYVHKYGDGFRDVDAERAKLMVPGVTGVSPVVTQAVLLEAAVQQFGGTGDADPDVEGLIELDQAVRATFASGPIGGTH